MKKGLGAAVCSVCLLMAPAGGGAQDADAPRSGPEQRRLRYQISIMERVLEGAVEHGASMTRERLRAWLPADVLLVDDARARGFRLEGYGMFFDVEVPALTGTLPWVLRTLDRNDLGLDSALKALRSHVEAAGDPNLEQALRRIELQMTPPSIFGSAVPGRLAVGVPGFTGSAASTTADRPGSVDARPQDPSPAQSQGQAVEPMPDDPEETYRAEIRQALMDAMLDHSRGLDIAPGEWLHIAARRSTDRTRLDRSDEDARTVMIRVRGSELAAYMAGRLAREDARQRMEVREF